MKRLASALVLSLLLVGLTAGPALAKAEKTDLVTYGPVVYGPVVGSVIFNNPSGPDNLGLTVQLKKVTPDTAYDIYLFVDGWASGTGIVLGTVTTNVVGNATFHANTIVTPGLHTVAIDVTLAGSGSDLYVTPGLYGQDLSLTFK